MPPTSAIPDARWSVAWITKGDRYERDCGGDLAEALRLYALLIKAGKTGATLRCMNVAFPPPVKYADREAVYKRRRRKLVKVGERTIMPPRYMDRMDILNRKGAWWCPYCIKLRKFEKRGGFEYEGIWVEKPAYYCPMCDVSSRDNGVIRFNPVAVRLMAGRRSKGRRQKKRGRRKPRR